MNHTYSDDHEESSRDQIPRSRRDVLKNVGATAGVGVLASVASGSASAHKLRWYGCSQVCSNNDRDYAVVDTGEGLACRPMDTGRRERQDIPNPNNPGQSWTGGKHCHEVEAGEAIIGVCEDGETFVESPNRCAENYEQPSGDTFCNQCP